MGFATSFPLRASHFSGACVDELFYAPIFATTFQSVKGKHTEFGGE